jgi:FG-GAP repeat
MSHVTGSFRVVLVVVIGAALVSASLLVPGPPARAASGGNGSTGLTVGDFDGDGRDDLAIGVNGEGVDTHAAAGAVNVLYGLDQGLSGQGDQFFHQDLPGIEVDAAPGDEFGSVLAAGNFNDDRFDDLAIGSPQDHVPDTDEVAGTVTVLYGSSNGLRAAGSDFWHQDVPNVGGRNDDGDKFGAALAVGDFGNGPADDLAIGAPGDILTVGLTDIAGAGSVYLLFGSSNGLRAQGSQFWHQNRDGVRELVETNDEFGTSLAAANFGKSGREDLAIGAAFEDVVGNVDAGLVHVLYGRRNGGLTARGDDLLRQGVGGVPDTIDAEEWMGWSLGAGNTGKSGHADLAIAAPLENAGAFEFSGIVITVYGGEQGIRSSGGQVFSRARLGFPTENDTFGSDLIIADLVGSDRKDLAIGSEFATVQGTLDAGAVHVIRGTPTGLQRQGDRVWHQNSAGVAEMSEEDDSFGLSLAAGDLGKSGARDLAIGVALESLPGPINDAGIAHVLYGRDRGISSRGDQMWSQDSPGVLDDAEEDDTFSSFFRSLD